MFVALLSPEEFSALLAIYLYLFTLHAYAFSRSLIQFHKQLCCKDFLKIYSYENNGSRWYRNNSPYQINNIQRVAANLIAVVNIYFVVLHASNLIIVFVFVYIFVFKTLVKHIMHGL